MTFHVVDNDHAVTFSDEFHAQVQKDNNHVNVVIGNDFYSIVNCDIKEFTPAKVYCTFRCWRDMQTFLAVRGWSYSNFIYAAAEGTPNYVSPNQQFPNEPEQND